MIKTTKTTTVIAVYNRRTERRWTVSFAYYSGMEIHWTVSFAYYSGTEIRWMQSSSSCLHQQQRQQLNTPQRQYDYNAEVLKAKSRVKLYYSALQSLA